MRVVCTKCRVASCRYPMADTRITTDQPNDGWTGLDNAGHPSL